MLHSNEQNAVLPLVTAWMDSENIMLNEVSQTKTNTHMVSLIHGI